MLPPCAMRRPAVPASRLAARRSGRRIVAALSVLVGLLVLAGCGSEVGRTALVPRNPRWVSPTTLQVDVECADELAVTVAVGAGTEQLPLITIWGEPNRDGCWTPVVLTLPPGSERLDDAASGTVIDLPAPPST